MYSIRYLLILAILLSTACSSTPSRQQELSEGPTEVNGEISVSAAEKHLYRQAITALNAGQLDEAESLLRTFSEQKPQFAGPLANLGLVYYKKGNKELAAETLNRALEKNSKQAHALNLLGEIAYEEGQASKAEDYYKRALAIKDDYANAHYNLALVYDIYFQDVARAVVHYRRYMELTNFDDKDTANWLEQLENSLKSS